MSPSGDGPDYNENCLQKTEPCSLEDNYLEKKLWRIITASAKGFTIGAGIKGGLSLLSILVRLWTRRRIYPFTSTKRKITSTLSNIAHLLMASKETLRYGLFVGTFAATFVSVDELIAVLGGDHKTANWRALLAGLIAGPSMLLTKTNTQHTTLAIYLLMHASILAARCGMKSEKFGYICKPLTWSHGDIFLMCLSSSQILSAYILNQNSLPPSYKSFLNKHGGKDIVILQGIKELACHMPFTNLQGIEKHYKSMNVNIKLDPGMKVPCSIVHGRRSCFLHGVSFFLQAYGRALPVYLPLYLIPCLIARRRELMKRLSISIILGKGLLDTARSSLFLSAYSSSAWMWTCLLFRVTNSCTIPLVAMGTFATGLALGIEKKSKRMEISLYCLARATESFFTCMGDACLLPQSNMLKRADVFVFSFSTAIIMHCYAQERGVFRSKYLNVLDWIFGVPPSAPETSQALKVDGPEGALCANL